MFVRNLGSGSAGNATVVAHEGRAILVDAGLSRRRMIEGLGSLRLEGVLITHVHCDHWGPQAQSLGTPVWIERANARAAARRRQIDGKIEVFDGAPFRVGPFRVTAFPLPHPGGQPWTSHGFRIEYGRHRLAYATDLGHVSAEVVEALSGAEVVFLESNHDREMERTSGRPRDVVEWVLSDTGHLSNEQCAEALSKMARPHTVILGHLSEDCNRPSLAIRLARKAVPRSTRLLVTLQKESSEAITI